MKKREKILFWVLVISLSAIFLAIVFGKLGIINDVSAEELQIPQEQKPSFEIIVLGEYPSRGKYVEYKTIDHEEGVICYNTLSHHGGVHNSHKNSFAEKWCFQIP